MKNSIYMDGISNIAVVDGVVRFDLVTLANASQPPQKNAAPKIEVMASVAASLPCFLRMHEQMSNVVNNMIEQGLIKKNPPADTIKVSAPATQQ